VVRGGTTTVEFGPDATQVDVLAAAAGAEPHRHRHRGGDAMTATLTSPPSGEPQAPSTGRNRILPSPVTGQELVLIGVIAVIWVGLALATPAFLTAGSIRPLLVATAPIALIGIGMTIIIITGGIDVSVGGRSWSARCSPRRRWSPRCHCCLRCCCRCLSVAFWAWSTAC
jgi:hypothetical protein